MRRDHQGQGGGPLTAAAEPDRSTKRYRLGTHRVCPPEETWEALLPHLAPAGITRLADVTALDRLGVPVYQAVRPTSRNLSVSQGKGLTPAAARVSAAMEALELWHAERLDHLPQVQVSLREMEYANPIRAQDLPWVEGAVGLDAAPVPWVPARSLVSGRRAWLPRELLEVDFTVPEVLRPRMLYASSNGLASGNCPEEAQLHALCEVVERHGLHLSREGSRGRTAVDPGSVDDPACRRLIEGIARAGMKLGIFDVGWEAGVPSLQVDLVAPDLPNVWLGAGTHPSPAVALARALTEAAQSRLAYISGARDDLPRLRLGPDRGVGDHRSYESYVPPAGGRPFGELPDLSTESVARDLETVVERVAAAGHEPYWVDLTRPEVGVSVVRVFVPGLREVRH